MGRSYPLPVTDKMKGGMLAAGIGSVFLIFSTVVLDRESDAWAVTAFYAMGAVSIVVGVFVFLRDYRVEKKRLRHVKAKGRGRPKDWDPKIGVTAHRDPTFDKFQK